MLFQKKGPLIHKVYFEQIDVVHTFLIYFVKPEKVVGVTFGKKNKGLEITNSDILPNKMLFFGTGARKIISKLGEKNEIVSSFFLKLRKCYLVCAKYIQQKLPLENKVWKLIAIINPG